ncbi:MAG: hypothetical protein LBH29_03135, partial [Elusimicrobiota bacterium]|nr:hypothetical protein [Elusimicrobiota bacterium]
MKKFYIVDGNAYIHRAYHALPPLSTSSRVQINAVFGFVKLLLKIKENFKPGYFAVCFDYPSKNFRHNLFKEYKAHRKPIDEALINQMPIAREAVEALNIKKVEIENYEADDLIASIVKKNRENKIETVIVTGDKDIMQLVFGEEVLVWNDSKEIMFGNSEVEEKFGVSPNQIIDLFSLMGDASDNVPGVKGIGEKTAVKLIKEYGNLENILSNAESIAGKTGKLIAEGRESALLSRKLIELKNDVPIGYGLESFENKSLDIEKAAAFFKKYEFKSLFEKYCGKASDNGSGKTKDGKEKEKENSAEISDKADFKSNREKAVFDIPENLEASFNYEIINSTDKLKTLVSEIEACGIFSIKTILNSPNYIKPHIVGASVSIDGKSYYIPVSHNILTAQQIDFEQFKEIFSPVLASKKIKKISSSLKFERNIYKILGIDIEGLFFDVSIASYCLNTFKSHDITSLSKEYLNFETGDDSFLGRGAKKISFADSQIEQTAVYAARIAFASFALYKIFKDGIDKLPLIPPDLFIDFHSGGVLGAKEGYNLFSDIEMPIL